MQTAATTALAVPKWAPDFQAQIPLDADPTVSQILVEDQALDQNAVQAAPALPSCACISTGHPITSSTLPEETQTPLLPAANDDLEKPRKPIRKRPSRRKPKRDDKRRSRTTLTISAKDYDAGMSAWGMAAVIGRPLDTLVTLRPSFIDELTDCERQVWFMKRLKSLGQWFADNDNRPEFTALWSREAKRIGVGRNVTAAGEHLHLLVHAGDHRSDLERMLRKSLKGPREVDVRPTTQEVMRLDCGWLGDAGTYVLKAVNQKVWRTYRTTPHRPSGPIFGARCGWTNNLDVLVGAR